MGHVAASERLARWAEVCSDASLLDLPYKIELNAYGTIEMSPAYNRHARLQGRIAKDPGNQLRDGRVFTECPIATEIGVRVPDVAWGSAAFLARHRDTTPFPEAPEICVGMRSRSNSRKEIALMSRAYLAAGTLEVWVVSEDGGMEFHGRDGPRTATAFNVRLELPPR